MYVKEGSESIVDDGMLRKADKGEGCLIIEMLIPVP